MPKTLKLKSRAPKTPVTRFETFRIAHKISVTRLYRNTTLSPRTVDLMRRGSNTTIDSMREIARTFGNLLERDVTVEELFDLTVVRLPSPKPKARAGMPFRFGKGQFAKTKAKTTAKAVAK